MCELPSSPSAHGRPPQAQQLKSTQMKGFLSLVQPPIETPTLPPSEAANTRSGSISASAPNIVSTMRNPVRPRAAQLAGRTAFAIVPAGAVTSIARKTPSLLGIAADSTDLMAQ